MEIAKRWPTASLRTEWDTEPRHYCLVTLDNGWGAGIGYDKTHYSSTRLDNLADPTAAYVVEIAIFRPSGRWYISEGMSADPAGKSGILAWVDSETVFQILAFIAQKEGE